MLKLVILCVILLYASPIDVNAISGLDDGEPAQEPDDSNSANATAECNMKGLHPCHCVFTQQLSMQPTQVYPCVSPVCQIAYDKADSRNSNSSSTSCASSDGCSQTWLEAMLGLYTNPPSPSKICCCVPPPQGVKGELICIPTPLQAAKVKHHLPCQNTSVAEAVAATRAAGVVRAYSGPSGDYFPATSAPAPVPVPVPIPAPVPPLGDSSTAGSYNVLMWGLFAVPIVIVSILLCGCW